MTGDSITPEQAPSGPLYAPQGDEPPAVGPSRASRGGSGPQAGAQRLWALERANHWADLAEESHQEAERYLDQIQKLDPSYERDRLTELKDWQLQYRQLDIELAHMWAAIAAATPHTTTHGTPDA